MVRVRVDVKIVVRSSKLLGSYYAQAKFRVTVCARVWVGLGLGIVVQR